MKKLFVIIFLVLLSVSVFAGPFGLEMGMTYEQIKDACGGRLPTKIDDGKYIIIPSKPHPYFIVYVAWIDDTDGLTYIKAIGEDISTNGSGISLKSRFDSLEESLSKTYGKNIKIDFLIPDSIWKDYLDWMSALSKNERYLMCEWSADHGSTLPSDISVIYMAAVASSSSIGYVALEYEFANHKAVNEAKKEKEDSVF